MVQQPLNGSLATELGRVKAKMIGLAAELASEDKWSESQRMQGWARTISQILQEMNQDNAACETMQGGQPVAHTEPYFFVDRGDKLVMRARNRNGPGFYHHRIVRPHYELVIQKIVALAHAGKGLRSQELQNRQEMPVHEPLEIVRLLEARGLLVKVQKGTFAFRDPHSFRDAAARLWSELPRDSRT